MTAVASPDDDGEQPSRFLHELGAGAPDHHQGRPHRPLSLAGLVAELRRTAADPAEPPDLRRAAAHRLAALADDRGQRPPAGHRRRPGHLVGAACPEPFHDARPTLGRAGAAVRDALQGLLTCPAQWFLQQEAGGAVVSPSARASASIVHALAERVAKGELGARRRP